MGGSASQTARDPTAGVLSELAAIVARQPGWAYRGLELGERLTVHLIRSGDPERRLDLIVSPFDPSVRGFRKLTHCQIQYRAELGDVTAAIKEQARALVTDLAELVDARLAAHPGAPLAEALGRSVATPSLVFGLDAVRALLAPEIVAGVPFFDGWALADVRAAPPDHAAPEPQAAPPPEVVVAFEQAGSDRRAFFSVALTSDGERAFARSAHFAIGALESVRSHAKDSDSLGALFALALQIHDHAGLEIASGERPRSKRLRVLTKADALPGGRVVLSIQAPCHQTCAFCDLQERVTVDDGGDVTLSRLVDELRAGRLRGETSYILNGIDPLAFSRVLDVLDQARALGYRAAEVYSPCTLLADRAFCEAFVARLPPERRVHVPLYALDERHDVFVGRPGAFAGVLKALDHLVALLGAANITITTVAMKKNLADLPALAAFASERGHAFFSTMPYPSTELYTDRMRDTSPRQSEVAALLVAHFVLTPERIGGATFGVVPCVIFAETQRRGIPVQSWLTTPAARPTLNGGPSHAVVPCPHEDACALASACPGELFALYTEQYGTDELHPVSRHELGAGARDASPDAAE